MKFSQFVYQGPSFVGITKVGASFRDVRTVIHGPRGDGFPGDMVIMRERLAQLPPVVCANLRSREMFSGSLPRLASVISGIFDAGHPGIVLIAETLSASLLKEDVRLVLRQLPEDRRGRVLVPDIDYLRGREDTAAAATLLEFVRRFAVPCERSATPTVNILGPGLLSFGYQHDIKAVRELLEGLGIGVNLVVPYGSSMADLAQLNRAWANVCTDEAIALPAAAYLRERFGTPALTRPPFGLAGTRRFLETLAGICGAGAGAYIERRERELRERWPEFLGRGALRGRTTAVFGDVTSAAGLRETFTGDLGAPCVAGTYSTCGTAPLRARVAELGDGFFVTDDPEETARRITEAKPGLVLGTLNEERAANRFGIPCVRSATPMRHVTTSIIPFQSFLGYAGFHSLLFNINQALRVQP